VDAQKFLVEEHDNETSISQKIAQYPKIIIL
jgi:hypothetical protein